jgi:hypothetical protein
MPHESSIRFPVWAPISTAPRDGTRFLAWVRLDWIEVMYYEAGKLIYGSDGDSPSLWHQPLFWMPCPPQPEQPCRTPHYTTAPDGF